MKFIGLIYYSVPWAPVRMAKPMSPKLWVQTHESKAVSPKSWMSPNELLRFHHYCGGVLEYQAKVSNEIISGVMSSIGSVSPRPNGWTHESKSVSPKPYIQTHISKAVSQVLSHKFPQGFYSVPAFH